MTDSSWMQLALEQADLAASHGDVPIGCVIVNAEGQELARGENRRELDGDPTGHAELVALRAAARPTDHARAVDLAASGTGASRAPPCT